MTISKIGPWVIRIDAKGNNVAVRCKVKIKIKHTMVFLEKTGGGYKIMNQSNFCLPDVTHLNSFPTLYLLLLLKFWCCHPRSRSNKLE